MDTIIQTVLGPIQPGTLGLTSMYDHVFYDGTNLCRQIRAKIPSGCRYRDWFPMENDEPITLENMGMLQRNAILSEDAFRQTDEEALKEELKFFRAAGGGALLSLGSPDISYERYSDADRRISKDTGVHIIESFSFSPSGPLLPSLLGLSAQQKGKLILEQIGSASVVPGHLAISLSRIVTDDETTIRAVAIAAKETGLSMTIQMGQDERTDSDSVIHWLKEENISPERVVISEVPLFHKPSRNVAIREPGTVTIDISKAEKYLDKGFNLSCCVPSTMRAELSGDYDCGDFLNFAAIYALIEKGYCRQLVLGNGCSGKITLHGSGERGIAEYLIMFFLCSAKQGFLNTQFAV